MSSTALESKKKLFISSWGRASFWPAAGSFGEQRPSSLLTSETPSESQVFQSRAGPKMHIFSQRGDRLPPAPRTAVKSRRYSQMFRGVTQLRLDASTFSEPKANRWLDNLHVRLSRTWFEILGCWSGDCRYCHLLRSSGVEQSF